MDDAVLRRCEGEYLDVSFQERTSVSVDDYIDMVSKRIGSLYGAAAELASILKDEASDDRRDALRTFGDSIGVVKQLGPADYDAFFSGKDRDPVQQGRIISKKKNLAMASFFETVKDPWDLAKSRGDVPSTRHRPVAHR